jgi:hypothetical protein
LRGAEDGAGRLPALQARNAVTRVRPPYGGNGGTGDPASTAGTDPSTGLEAGPPPLRAGEVLRGRGTAGREIWPVRSGWEPRTAESRPYGGGGQIARATGGAVRAGQAGRLSLLWI